MIPTLLTPKEAAALLKVSVSTLRWWRHAGKGPPVVKIGPATFRYSQEALVAYIEHQICEPEKMR
jgi:excisionase family DNA binding protein